MGSKYYYEQFSDLIKEEEKEYEARSEKRQLSQKKCKHRSAKIKGNRLRCGCGAFWEGAGIDKLHKILNS
jgi:hypothetical protein